MRIISWNINSLRLRLPLLKQLTLTTNPDIICLQETKVPDTHFPLDALHQMGYPHVLFRGEKGYNGVAILSRLPVTPLLQMDVAGSKESRHISAMLPQGIELHNFYVPAGGDEPDITINPKYKFKLDFVDDMALWFTHHRKSHTPIILVGDLNIAPLEHDVWSHKQLLTVVSHTQAETGRLLALKKTLDWIDIPRTFVSEEKKLYSWWSYRNRDWKKSNRGRRLDHIWCTAPLKPRIAAHQILSHCRDWDRPSDHVPVIADFA